MNVRESLPRKWVGLGLALLLLGGCGDSFDPPSYLNDLRVLAIAASPLEVGPFEEVVLTPTVYVPPGRTATGAWSFCPLSAGQPTAFECAVPACEFPLESNPDTGAVRANPTALALRCLEAMAGEGEQPPQGIPSELPQSLETVFTYQVETDDGQLREAVQRVTLWTTLPAARNRAPVIARVELAGVEVAAGGAAAAAVKAGDKATLRVVVDPESMDAFEDAAGLAQLEEPIVSYFATAGRFEADRGQGTDSLVEWEAVSLAPEDAEAQLWVVVRDLRGGQTVAGPFRIPIAR